MIFLLLLLIIIPILAFKWAKYHCSEYKFTILGVSFGAIVAPFSLGLYATFFIPYIGLPTGLLGLIMVMFHGSLGYHLALQLGIVPTNVITDTGSNVIIAIINGFLWAVIYGILGYLIDKYRNYRKSSNR